MLRNLWVIERYHTPTPIKTVERLNEMREPRVDWTNDLPQHMNVENLVENLLDRDRPLNQIDRLLDAMIAVTNNLSGPKGFTIFYTLLHHLLIYATCCLKENKFPALNRCWDKLSPQFIHSTYEDKWVALCWIFCDFPLGLTSDAVLLDAFEAQVLTDVVPLPAPFKTHLVQFSAIMKRSWLGLYQEILSTSTITKFRELFTGRVISTVRCVPEYDSGEIFLARMVSYLGDSFTIHDLVTYPKETKFSLEEMIRQQLPLMGKTDNEVRDYQRLMKLAGPYWMSCTHSEDIPLLPPDEYKSYYK